MKFYGSTGRQLCDLEFSGRGVDIYLERASYLDDGTDVPEDELDYATKGECLCFGCREGA